MQFVRTLLRIDTMYILCLWQLYYMCLNATLLATSRAAPAAKVAATNQIEYDLMNNILN